MHETFTRSASGQRVLMVDDERAVRQTLSLIFKTNGYQTHDADSAEEAEPHCHLDTTRCGCGRGFGSHERSRTSDSHQASVPLIPLLFSGHPESGGLVNEAGRRGEVSKIAAKPVHPDFVLEWVGKRLEN